MKIIRHDSDDELRAEYKRSDFGEMIRGKYAANQVEFAELVGLLVTCVGEDVGLSFIHHSRGNYLAGHNRGDWTYEIDNTHQITLRYWLNETSSIEEQITNPSVITTVDQRSELNHLLTKHVKALHAKVVALDG